MSMTAIKGRRLVDEARAMLESVLLEISALEAGTESVDRVRIRMANAARAVRLAAEKLERLAKGRYSLKTRTTRGTE